MNLDTFQTTNVAVVVVVVVAEIVECNNQTRFGCQVFVFKFEFVLSAVGG